VMFLRQASPWAKRSVTDGVLFIFWLV
jgi:hypothetical protein